ncbi:hypothetical protein, partial [Streptococcus pyogenes]|uniref:hypothetical protein n=1 Tax=Streptococcus pyogenes TaxID=1314 RepID=UPI003D010E3C
EASERLSELSELNSKVKDREKELRGLESDSERLSDKVVSFPYVPFPNEPLYRSDAQNRSLSPLILFLGLLPW